MAEHIKNFASIWVSIVSKNAVIAIILSAILTGLSAWYVAGNLMPDAAALNKEEMLPWEKWSVGLESGPDRAIPEARLVAFDRVAEALRGPASEEQARRVYRENRWLRVPKTVHSFLNGWPPTEVAVR